MIIVEAAAVADTPAGEAMVIAISHSSLTPVCIT